MELGIVHVFRVGIVNGDDDINMSVEVWFDELGKDRMSLTTSGEGFKMC